MNMKYTGLVRRYVEGKCTKGDVVSRLGLHSN